MSVKIQPSGYSLPGNDSGIIVLSKGRVPANPVPGAVVLYADAKVNNISLIPEMTSASAPSGVASDDTHYGGVEAWMAMGGAYNGWLTAGAKTGWIQYQFPTPTFVSAYGIRPWFADNFPGRAPKDWTLQGSNDGVNFNIISSVSGASWGNSTDIVIFQTANISTMTYYRLVVTDNVNGGGYTGIGRFQLYSPGSQTLPVEIRCMDSDGLVHRLV